MANITDATRAPKRIQLRRTKGWRKPEGAVVVARPTKWGNPVRVKSSGGISVATQRAFAVVVFEEWLAEGELAGAEGVGPEMERRRQDILDGLAELRGRDLACWCPLNQPCHADVLLALANKPEQED